MAEIILEAWVEFSKEEDGSVIMYKPTWRENKEEFADFIIDRLIADPRSEHEGIDLIRSTDSGLRDEIATLILHFDKKLFIDESQQWNLQGESRALFSAHDIFIEIFDKIIPTQFVAAIARFIKKWTNDINLRECDINYEYLISNYNLEIKGKNIKKSWQRWTQTKEKLKSLMFFERVGYMCPALFHSEEGLIAKQSPLLFRGVVEAFYKDKPGKQPWPFSFL